MRNYNEVKKMQDRRASISDKKWRGRFVVLDIEDYIAEDNPEYAAKTIREIYAKFENIQVFPAMGTDLSKKVSFQTDYKYTVWKNYVIIYKMVEEYVEIYRIYFLDFRSRIHISMTYINICKPQKKENPARCGFSGYSR